MNSLNVVSNRSQVASFQNVNSLRELEEVSLSSPVSSHSSDDAWISVEANANVEQEEPRLDQESMIRSLMASVQELNEKSVVQDRKYTELKESHSEFQGRVEVLITENKTLRAENQAFLKERDQAKTDSKRALGVAQVAVQDRREQAVRVGVLEEENESLRLENGNIQVENVALQEEVDRLLNEANRTNGFFFGACEHLKRSYKNPVEGALKGYIALAVVGAAGPIVPEIGLAGAGVYGIANIASASIKPIEYAFNALRF